MATSNTVNIHLPPGQHQFMHQRSCLLQNKTGIKFTGNSSNDTILECQEPFNIVFVGVKGIMISNITMMNCGNEIDDLINQTIYNATLNDAHFGSGSRFALIFFRSKISEFTMLNTLGYGIIAFNLIQWETSLFQNLMLQIQHLKIMYNIMVTTTTIIQLTFPALEVDFL